MMHDVRVRIALALALALVACGGPAAKAPEVDPLASSPSSSSASPKPPTPPDAARRTDVAPPSGADVKRGIAALEAGDLEKARAAFDEALKKNPKQADAHYYRGLVLDRTGDRRDAEAEYKEALASDPNLVEASANLVALYVESKRYDDAASTAKKALERSPKHGELLLNYAVALGMKGDAAASTRAFEDALKVAPTDPRFHLAYGQQLAQWKKTDEALAHLKQADKGAADDPGILASVGLEFKGLGAFNDCVSTLDRAIRAKDIAELRTYRALCKLGLKDKKGALDDLQVATTKEPNVAPPHYHLANALADTGNYKGAIAEWSTYLRLAPSGPMAKQAEERIKIAEKRDKAKK